MIGLSYREHRPPVDLSGWVACFWEIKGCLAQVFEHRVLPDGCVDLLFDLREASAAVDGATIVGPMSSVQVIGLRGGVDLLGVRLRCGVAAPFLQIPADRLLDISVPLLEGPRVLQIEAQELACLPDSAARIARLIAACRARLAAVRGLDPIVSQALAIWSGAAGLPSVSVLVRDIGLSERAFERRFVSSVGLTPVRFRRLARLRTVLGLYANGTCDWATLAASNGYSDQSHLVRDFQAFVGLSPTRWAASQIAHAGFLQDGRITAL